MKGKHETSRCFSLVPHQVVRTVGRLFNASQQSTEHQLTREAKKELMDNWHSRASNFGYFLIADKEKAESTAQS